VICCEEEEAKEVTGVSVADACAHPRAVMIVDFNTNIAVAAVKCSRGSQNPATGAVRKLVMLIFLIKFVITVLVKLGINVLELAKVKEPSSMIGLIPFLTVEVLVELLLIHILDLMLELRIILVWILFFRKARYNSRI
jgi:hypothetical protein